MKAASGNLKGLDELADTVYDEGLHRALGSLRARHHLAGPQHVVVTEVTDR
jgi:hypothetical protein